MNKLAFSLNIKYGAKVGETVLGTPSIGNLVTNVVDTLIAIGAIIALFLFITAGYQIISAAGNNDPKRQSQGQQTLTYAIIGFIITFASYWIIRFLEVILKADFISTNPF